MSDDLALFVNGKIYRGWTDISLTRAMDAIAGAFAISLTERWAGDGTVASQSTPWPILNGDKCRIELGGEAIVDGYVDQFRPSFSATDHTIEIQGRDKTGDLVDCSAFHQPDQWKNQDLLQIAKILCAPFGVTVRADVDVGPPFPTIKLQQGETVFAALDRLARFRKVLLAPDKAGGVVIARAGTTRSVTPLIQGVNILSASGSLDTTQRFSNYIVKGQTTKSTTDDGVAESHQESRVTDSDVPRYRPLVLMAESGSNPQDRATWEANVRLGRSATAKITVRGWRQTEGGTLWAPNQLVAVKSAWLRMDGDMLIRQVTYKRNGSEGTLVELDLVSPQAFSPEPPDTTKEKGTAAKGKGDSTNIWRAALGNEK
jgi:prophage tail gpP-like protein